MAIHFRLQEDIPNEEYMLYMTYMSTFSFGTIFLSGDFQKSKPSIFHMEFCEELDSDDMNPLFAIVPRGHAKTTMCKANIIHDFVWTPASLKAMAKRSTSSLKDFWYEEARKKEEYGPRYYVWIAKSQDDSKGNMEYVTKHFEENPLIIKYFGNLKGPIWNKEYIETSQGDVLACGSNLKSVRGKTKATVAHGALRISRVYADDMENELNTKTFQSRQDLKRTLFAGTVPAIEVDKPHCRLIVTGTPVHFDSLIQNVIDKYHSLLEKNLLHTYEFKVIFYRATQPDMEGGVLWHGHVPRSVLNRQKAINLAAGTLQLYFQEYELEVSGDILATWTRKHFGIHTGQYKRIGNENFFIINNVAYPCLVFIGGDPATDIETKTSDYSVLLAIAVLPDNTRYVLEYQRHLSIPNIGIRDPKTDELIGRKGYVDYLFEMYDRYNCEAATIENVAMTRSIMTAIRGRQLIKNRFDIVIKPISPAGKNKHNKIYSYLDPLFAQGALFYRETHEDLIDETLRFGPKMSHDDTIESLYFSNVNAYPPNSTQYIQQEQKSEMQRIEDKLEMMRNERDRLNDIFYPELVEDEDFSEFDSYGQNIDVEDDSYFLSM